MDNQNDKGHLIAAFMRWWQKAKVRFWQLVVMELGASLYKLAQRPLSFLDFSKSLNRKPLWSLFTHKHYDPERRLYHNHDSVGFCLLAIPASGLGVEEIRTLEGIFTNNYRPGTVIQIINYANPNVDHIIDGWAGQRGEGKGILNREIFRRLADSRAKYLKQAAWRPLFNDEYLLMRDFQLVVTVAVPLARGQEELSRAELDELERHRDALLGILRSANVTAEPMTPPMLIELMGDIFRPKLDAGEVRQRVPYDPNVELRRQFVADDAAVYFGRDDATIDWKGNLVSVLPFAVKQFPDGWAASLNGELLGPFFNRVQRLSCPFMCSMVVEVPDQVSMMGNAKAKLMRATQMKDSPIGRYVPAWMDREVDWKYVVGRMEQGSKMLQVGYNIMLFAEAGTEEAAEQSLKSVYAARGWAIVKSRFVTKPRMMHSLPLNCGREAMALNKKLMFSRSMLSWNCVNLAPWIGEWKGNVAAGQDPLLMFVGRRGQLCYLDPFRNTKGNFNMAVTAASGSGKSVFSQEFLESFLSKGGRSFVIDSGRSYENMCKVLDGVFIDFSKLSNPVLNPFTTIVDKDVVDEAVWRETPNSFEDQLPMLSELISSMADPVNPLPSKHKALLLRAITDAWHEKKQKASITTVGRILDSYVEHPEARDLAVMLSPFMERGAYAEYFEGEANIDFNNPLIVLELDDLNAKPDLQRIIVLLLMKRITEVMYLSGRKQRKLAIIDEAWRFLGGAPAAAAMIEEGYRTARKYNGAFMTITQRIGDYFGSAATKAAYANSDFVFILRQKPEALAEVKANQQLMMNDWEERVYESIKTFGPDPYVAPHGKYSEIAIKSPDGMAVGLLVLDPFSSRMKSTKAEDVEAIKAYEKAGMTKLEAIEKVAML